MRGEKPSGGDANGAIPECCPTCGGTWVYRAPWWGHPAREPEWGYLVHCEGRHFRWFPAELSAAELAEAQVRFGVAGGSGREPAVEDPTG